MPQIEKELNLDALAKEYTILKRNPTLEEIKTVSNFNHLWRQDEVEPLIGSLKVELSEHNLKATRIKKACNYDGSVSTNSKFWDHL